MSNVLREYEENGFKITEYTSDGKTVSASVKELIMDDLEPIIPEIGPAPEEVQLQTLLNTELLVILSEINGQ